jgi:hypothetical protein
VKRSDLMEQFGLPVNQGAVGLDRYFDCVSDNMVHDKSVRAYVRGPDYIPKFLKPDVSRYLAQLRSLADGILDSEDTWIAELPAYDAAPTPVSGVNLVTLRSVPGANRCFEAIELKYHSLSRHDPHWRWIAPNAIGFDGLRWHTRAFCMAEGAFKDFLLLRVLELFGARGSRVPAKDDRDWNRQVLLEIGPHPALSESEAKVIALGCGMRGGGAKIKVGRELLYYALRRLGLYTDPCARKPKDRQTVLLNREAIDEGAG